MRLLVITPWKSEWQSERIHSYPEIYYVKPFLKNECELEVISPYERPRHKEYDTIWCQSEIPYSYARWLTKDLKHKKFVVSIYGIFERFPLRLKNRILYPIHILRYKKLDEAFKNGADVYLITDDGSLGGRLAQMYKVDYVLLKNPKPEYRPIEKMEARRILGIYEEGVMGAFIGRFSKFKGVQYLRKIYRRGDPYKLLVVGSGFDEEFRTWVKYNHSIIIEQYPHEEINVVYSAADFVLMPYIYGNKTAVMIESLTYGLTTISFKAHTTDEIIKDGYNGFLAKNFSSKDFRKKCLIASKNEDLRRSISKRTSQIIKDFPTWKEHANVILENLKP